MRVPKSSSMRPGWKPSLATAHRVTEISCGRRTPAQSWHDTGRAWRPELNVCLAPPVACNTHRRPVLPQPAGIPNSPQHILLPGDQGLKMSMLAMVHVHLGALLSEERTLSMMLSTCVLSLWRRQGICARTATSRLVRAAAWAQLGAQRLCTAPARQPALAAAS